MRNKKTPAKASEEAAIKMKDVGSILWASDPQLHDALISAADVQAARSVCWTCWRRGNPRFIPRTAPFTPWSGPTPFTASG